EQVDETAGDANPDQRPAAGSARRPQFRSDRWLALRHIGHDCSSAPAPIVGAAAAPVSQSVLQCGSGERGSHVPIVKAKNWFPTAAQAAAQDGGRPPWMGPAAELRRRGLVPRLLLAGARL